MEPLIEQVEIFRHPGFCPLCETQVNFVAKGAYFRNTLKCDKCGSLPRQRVLMKVLMDYFPNWRDLRIHESSPGWDMVSQRLAKECKAYIASQYDMSVPPGMVVQAPRMPCKQYRSENLECQTFEDEQFDIFIAQDVFEHLFRPDLAVKEIARTLRPCGAVLMTVPLVCRQNPSRRRARMEGTDVVHLLPEDYHGNPLGGGSLVTIDWGYDILTYLAHHGQLSMIALMIDNIDLGIRAALNDVVLGFKRGVPSLS